MQLSLIIQSNITYICELSLYNVKYQYIGGSTYTSYSQNHHGITMVYLSHLPNRVTMFYICDCSYSSPGPALALTIVGNCDNFKWLAIYRFQVGYIMYINFLTIINLAIHFLNLLLNLLQLLIVHSEICITME